MKFLSLALLITLSRQSTTLRAVMASSPSSNLLNLPPIRPNLSQTKSNSFTRSTSQSGSPNGGGNSSQVSRSSATATKRARSSSIVSVTEVKETYDDQLDQAALHNMNAEWVNYKGSFPVSSHSARVRTKVQGSDKGYPSFNPTDALSLCNSLVGAWMIHVVLIALGIVLLETVPGITQDVTWTTANLGYLFVRFPLLSLFSSTRGLIKVSLCVE